MRERRRGDHYEVDVGRFEHLVDPVCNGRNAILRSHPHRPFVCIKRDPHAAIPARMRPDLESEAIERLDDSVERLDRILRLPDRSRITGVRLEDGRGPRLLDPVDVELDRRDPEPVVP